MAAHGCCRLRRTRAGTSFDAYLRHCLAAETKSIISLMSSGAVQRALLVWAAALGACSSQAGSDGATGGQGSGTGLGDGGPVDVSGGVPGGMTGSGGGAVAGGSRTAEAGGTVAGGSRAAGGAGQGSSDAGMAGQGGAWDGAVGGETGGLDGAGDPCGPGNPAVVPLPVIGAGTFAITTYGAVGDGKTDNSKAIQAALTAAGAAGGGTVSVPAGTFLSGPVVLASGTRSDLASGATLMMLPMASYGAATPFITADHAHDIALTGSGTIDGQGQDWWTAFASDSSLSRPQEVQLLQFLPGADRWYVAYRTHPRSTSGSKATPTSPSPVSPSLPCRSLVKRSPRTPTG